jgi:hypothetical protein
MAALFRSGGGGRGVNALKTKYQRLSDRLVHEIDLIQWWIVRYDSALAVGALIIICVAMIPTRCVDLLLLLLLLLLQLGFLPVAVVLH